MWLKWQLVDVATCNIMGPLCVGKVLGNLN